MTRDNNLNLIRVLAAAAVIVSHSYALVGLPEPLAGTLGYTLGELAVKVFFAVSGYLIYKSWSRSTFPRYLQARMMRLFPALLCVSLAMLLAIGPILTGAPDYWSNPVTWQFLPRSLLLPSQTPDLPGLFVGSPVPRTNGPLWTLHFEFAWYLIVAILGAIGAYRFLPAWVLLFAAVYVLAPNFYTWFGLPFVVGMIMAHYDHRPRGLVAILLIEIAFAGYYVGFGVELSTIALSYLTLWAGLKVTPAIQQYNRLGDYSYGIYIYGWPVQQVLRPFIPDDPVALAAASILATLPFAVASWHLVEERALSTLKSKQGADRRAVSVA